MGPLSGLPGVALTCCSGSGMWVELGAGVTVLGCDSSSTICLVPLPHHMSLGQSSSSPGSPHIPGWGWGGVDPLL